MIDSARLGDDETDAAAHPLTIVGRQAGKRAAILAPHPLHAGHDKAVAKLQSLDLERLEQGREVELGGHAGAAPVHGRALGMSM